MTDPNYAAIMLVIDRSGSMDIIRESAEEAINGFIRGQANESGRRTIRIAQFDEDYETVLESTDAAQCPPFKLEPRGVTALHDAMGQGMKDFGGELAALPEDQRPATVIFAIMTDGKENASQTYDRQRVRDLVRHQEDTYRWQILYLAANQDAIEEGAKLGIRRDQALTYNTTDQGVYAASHSLGDYVASSVSTGGRGSFTNEDREKAEAE